MAYTVLHPFSHPQLPVEEPIVSPEEVIFPLTVSLDRLPPGTPKAKVSPASSGWGGGVCTRTTGPL